MTQKKIIILLDSGAFSVFTRGHTIDLEKYAEFILGHRKMFRGGAFNLDVISHPERAATYSHNGANAIASSHPAEEGARKSYENWLELRRLGVNTIPVFHLGEDETYL